MSIVRFRSGVIGFWKIVLNGRRTFGIAVNYVDFNFSFVCRVGYFVNYCPRSAKISSENKEAEIYRIMQERWHHN